MTPRKWTAADVTDEDLRATEIETNIYRAGWQGSEMKPGELVAACWNRLEEKRSSPEIARLREIRDAALERMLTDFGSHHIKVEQYKEAEANLRAACGSDSVEGELQDPFFDADHLAEVGAYMEERAREKLLVQALEALDSVASESQLQLDHPKFPISDKNCDLIRAVMDQLPCKGWSIGGAEAQNLRAMAQYNEDHKPEAIAALEKEVGA